MRAVAKKCSSSSGASSGSIQGVSVSGFFPDICFPHGNYSSAVIPWRPYDDDDFLVDRSDRQNSLFTIVTPIIHLIDIEPREQFGRIGEIKITLPQRVGPLCGIPDQLHTERSLERQVAVITRPSGLTRLGYNAIFIATENAYVKISVDANIPDHRI
jgi:hypothetical protein